MSSDQQPPPLANISFPPVNTQYGFNSMDIFVTSWVTPVNSQDPCFFSINYWNDSSNGPWIIRLNETVPLNGTRLTALSFINSTGGAQAELNYVDPLGGHKHIHGVNFKVNYDPSQVKAMTWSQDTLSSTTMTPASTQPSSVPIPSISTSPTSSSSTSTPPSVTDSRTLSSTSTAAQSAGQSSSSPHGAEYASIALGTILGVAFAAALLAFWIRRKRRRRLAEQADHTFVAAPGPVQHITRTPQEKDGKVVLCEMGGGSGKWELDGDRRQ